MSTVSDIVRTALLHLRVIPANQPIKPHDMRDGISALNRMMTRWEADGVAVGWHTVDSPSDTLPVPPEAEEAIGYNLALRLRSLWGADLDPDVVEFAREGLARIMADIASRDAGRLSYDLPVANAQRPYGDLDGFLGGY